MRGLVGAPELAIMKPTARLVNTSRGPIVVEADLIATLKAQKIAGAAIDVFDQEPLPRKAQLESSFIHESHPVSRLRRLCGEQVR
jgi:phosphoglycerate dehydrogenase-like enzyme